MEAGSHQKQIIPEKSLILLIFDAMIDSLQYWGLCNENKYENRSTSSPSQTALVATESTIGASATSVYAYGGERNI